jgi:hypothetical protein
MQDASASRLKSKDSKPAHAAELGDCPKHAEGMWAQGTRRHVGKRPTAQDKTCLCPLISVELVTHAVGIDFAGIKVTGEETLMVRRGREILRVEA